MSVLTDTLHAFSARYSEALWAWFMFCALPLISCIIWTVRYFSHLDNPMKSFFRALAYSYGYPAALLGLVVVPIYTFSIFFGASLAGRLSILARYFACISCNPRLDHCANVLAGAFSLVALAPPCSKTHHS